MELQTEILTVLLIVGGIGIIYFLSFYLWGDRERIARLLGRIGGFWWRSPIYGFLPDAIIGVDRHGGIRSLNKAAEDLFEVDAGDVRGQPLASLIRGASANGMFQRGDCAVLEASAGINTQGIRRDGRTFPASCYPLDRSFIMVKDESARTEFVDLYRRSELLAGALEGVATPLLVTDQEGRVVMSNQACEAALGSPVPEGTRLEDLFPGAAASLHGVGRFEARRSGYTFTARPDAKSPGRYILVGSRHASRVRRFEDVLTEVNAYADLLLTSIEPEHPMREDLERISAAGKEGIAILRELTA